METKTTYDEAAKEAAACLLEQFWVLREDEPDVYRIIRERERVLRDYFNDKFGYRLIVHRHFAKLEKVPAEPEAWMGLQAFQSGIDYALFCCVLAFLEGRSVDEQFLLSQLCEDVQGLFPGEDRIDWTNYEYRKSLVRVMKTVQDFRLVHVVEGEVDGFSADTGNEVLYEVPLVSRYFMRSYPKDLFHFKSKEEILQAEWPDGMKPGDLRRYRVYRKLMLSPVVYREGKEDLDFAYIRNFRNRLKDDLEAHTEFRLDVYKNAAMLTMEDNRARYTLFPDNRAIADLVLQFAGIVREKQQTEGIPTGEDGTILVTQGDFQQWLAQCRDCFAHGWSKFYRETTLTQTAKDLLDVLETWKMAKRDEETGTVTLYPLLARMSGEYPASFSKEETTHATK